VKRRTPLKRGAPMRRGRSIARKRPERVARAVGGAAFSKDERIVDEEYLAWCREQHCGFCGALPPSQPHHVLPRRMGGANQRDDLAMPVCQRCHMRCDGQTVEGMGPWPKESQLERAATAREHYQRRRAADNETFPW
jgi:5-methylcytosine-specific restriction endonuclease McrA